MSSILFNVHGAFADISLTVEELACASRTDADWVIRHVVDDQLAARDGEPGGWRFDSAELRRARQIASVERMFEVNSDAAAFIADLLEEIRRLRQAGGAIPRTAGQ